jgi:hypothetical protein
MAINIDNTQYKQFILFASKNDQDTIARITQGNIQLDDGARNISVKEGDKANSLYYNLIGRNKDSLAVNNEVRDLFLNTVLEVCGVQTKEELPQDVKDAMRFMDYNRGRPLTARRIGLVKDAIMRVKAGEDANAAVAVNNDAAVNQGGNADPVNAYYREYGPFVKDTVQATVDELGDQAALGDIEVLDAAEMKMLREGSKAIKDFCFNVTMAYKVDEFCSELDRFKQTVLDNMKKLYPQGTGSAAMTALRTNMLLHYSALNLIGPAKSNFTLAVSNFGKQMVDHPQHKRLMDLIFPLADCIRYVEGKVED